MFRLLYQNKVVTCRVPQNYRIILKMNTTFLRSMSNDLRGTKRGTVKTQYHLELFFLGQDEVDNYVSFLDASAGKIFKMFDDDNVMHRVRAIEKSRLTYRNLNQVGFALVLEKQ